MHVLDGVRREMASSDGEGEQPRSSVHTVSHAARRQPVQEMLLVVLDKRLAYLRCFFNTASAELFSEAAQSGHVVTLAGVLFVGGFRVGWMFLLEALAGNVRVFPQLLPGEPA